jgi:hypothetical protein
MKFLLEKVGDMAGFAAEHAMPGAMLSVLVRDHVTSDEQEFYQYSEEFSKLFLNPIGIPADSVNQFLVVIHADLSADVYVNDVAVVIEIRAKRTIDAGQPIMLGDIADIRKVKFPNIEIKETDRVIYCFKVGWRFGLFFDLSARSQPAATAPTVETAKLDTERMELSIGDLRRYLTFYHVYKVLESETQFGEMLKDGWFPFVDIIASEYRALSEAYKDKFDFENRQKAIVDGFTEERIRKLTDKWWKNQTFADKRTLIDAGINAYLQNTQDGFINCIKNLSTEVEGILRKLYHAETGKRRSVKSHHLIEYIVGKAKEKSHSDDSLLFPLPFLKYLQDVVFANFNMETGQIDMSRNAASHGVAAAAQYTRERALQLILILDQIYFYS